MKRWLLAVIGTLAALVLMAGAAASRSEAGWNVGVGVGVGGYYGPGYYGPGYYGPYYGYYPYYPYYGYYPPAYYYPAYGFIQTAVKPEAAEVWVDGNYSGHAGDFNSQGNLLSVTPGTHDMQFRMPGYKTYYVSATVYPESTTVVEYELVPVGAGPPGEH
jgi:hypothetical protein